MSLPKVTILYANGGLLAEVAALDGIAGMVGTGYTPALLGVPKVVYTLEEAEELGITEADEPCAYRHIKEFYAEVGGSQELHIMLFSEETTMAEMLDSTDVNAARKLIEAAEGRIRLLAVFREPDDAYNPGTSMFDDDVEDALTAAKTFCEGRLAELTPLRVLVEGRVANFETKATGSYTITNPGSNTNTVTLTVEIPGEEDPVTLGAYTVTTGNTADNVATGLRAAINALNGTHGFSATGSGAVVTFVPPTGAGAAANDYVITATVTGGVAGTMVQLAGGSDYVTNSFSPSTLSNGYAGCVVGGTQNDGSASIGVVLGRAVKYPAHIKIGKVLNGPLSITDCYIGDEYIGKKDGERTINNTRLGNLHGQGFISFMKHPGKAGYYIGIDRMASTDDYRRLAYGRVIDKAAVITAAVYIEQLQNEVPVNAAGKIDSLALAALESAITQQINIGMAGQFSALIVSINPDQDIINTETLRVKIRIQPLGYTSFIDIDLGLTAPTAN